MAKVQKQITYWSALVLRLLPLAVPLVLAVFGVVALALLLLGALRTELVLATGVPLAAVAVIFVARALPNDPPERNKEGVVCDIMVLLGVLFFGVFNFGYASQHLFTNRDPATYANAAAWLINNESLNIETPKVFGENDNIVSRTPGFEHPNSSSEVVHAQGEHLLPVLLGVVGRFTGLEVMLGLMPFIGAAALLSVYGIVRQLARPRWALVTVAALAASLPMIYFSRDTYTEPLMMAFVFGSLGLLWHAQKTGSRALWLFAGLVAGAGAMARIDVYVTLAGFILFLVAYLAIAKKPERRLALARAMLFVLGATVTATVGWLDLVVLSAPYYAAHDHLFGLQLGLFVAAAVVGALLVLASWSTNWLSRLDLATRQWRAITLIVLVVVTAALLVSRPLWFTGHTASQSAYTATIQVAEGDPVEPRNYSEITTDWVVWYVGLALAVLGVAGLAWAAGRVTKKGGLVLVPAIATVFVTALVYLVKPSVAPDQVWASRRLLPVVLPGIALFGAYAISRAQDIVGQKRLLAVTAMVVAAVAIFLLPLATSAPFLKHRELAQLPLFTGLCERLPANAAVLWVGDGQHYSLAATRSVCNVPAQAYVPVEQVKSEDLVAAASAARSQGYEPVVAAFANEESLFSEQSRDNLTRVSDHTFYEISPTLTRPPYKIDTKNPAFVAGVIDNDGSIERL